jgi:hypothetical protein
MTATTGNTLTDRYVAATLRSVPERQRPEIEKELRASIADAVDDRIGAGTKPKAAEREVLVELGDPIRLAANYADRPLYLIGPALFPDYLRLLRVMLWVVVPIVAVVLVAVGLLQGHSIADITGSTIGTAITVGVHICFWTTLVFAIIERTPRMAKPLVAWSPDMLMDVPARRGSFGDLIGSVVTVVLVVALLLLSPVLTTVTDAEGDPVGILQPSLWQFWVPYLVVLAAIGIGFEFVKYYAGPTLPVAFGNLVINAAFGIPVAWLAATGQLLNPAFFEGVGWSDEVYGIVTMVIVVGTLIALAFDSIDGFVKAVRR